MTSSATIAGPIFADIPAAEVTEFEIQAWLFCELRKRGIHTRGEQLFYTEANRARRADLVVRAGHNDFAIEVKADGKTASVRQLRDYNNSSAFLGCMVICGQEHAARFMQTVDLYNNMPGGIRHELSEFGWRRIASRSKVMGQSIWGGK